MHFYRRVGYRAPHEGMRAKCAKWSKATLIETRLKLAKLIKIYVKQNNFNIGI